MSGTSLDVIEPPSPDDPEAWEAWCQRQEHLARGRVQGAVKELQARGLLDEKGQRREDSLPADMLVDSTTSVSTG